MSSGNQNAEQLARDQIDAKLNESGWPMIVDFNAASAIAVREFPTDSGPADYVLFLDCQPVGVSRCSARLTEEPRFEIPSAFPGRNISLLDVIRRTRNDLSRGDVHMFPQWSLEMIKLCGGASSVA
jgi:hypothetical protein